MFFDNLQLTHIQGHLQQEDTYYPFGMGIMAMSSKAANGLQNAYKYNGIAEEDNFDLGLYAAYYRMLDPQLGRWWQVDPKAIKYSSLSGYNSNFNNPVNFFDPWGDDPGWLLKLADNLFGGGRLPVVTVTANGPGGSEFMRFMTDDFLKPLGNSLRIAGNYLVQLNGRFNNLPFWNTPLGNGINNTSNWINHNINPVYLGVNGINSQFTGKDLLSGVPVSHAEGAAQLLSIIPIGKVTRLGEVGLEGLERVVVKDVSTGGEGVYDGIRTASKYLQQQGVPRVYRKKILESFEKETISLRTANKTTFGLRFYGGAAEESGRYLFPTFTNYTNRVGLALPNSWNSMSKLSQFQIVSGSKYLFGRAASQGRVYIGGSYQIYINNLDNLIKLR